MLSLDSSIMSRTTTLAIDFFRMSSYHTVCMHWYTELILLYLCCDDGFTRVVFLNFCFGVFDARASHFFLFLKRAFKSHAHTCTCTSSTPSKVVCRFSYLPKFHPFSHLPKYFFRGRATRMQTRILCSQRGRVWGEWRSSHLTHTSFPVLFMASNPTSGACS